MTDAQERIVEPYSIEDTSGWEVMKGERAMNVDPTTKEGAIGYGAQTGRALGRSSEFFISNSGIWQSRFMLRGTRSFGIDRPGPKTLYREEKMPDKNSKEISNLERVIDYHRRIFRTPENLNHYSQADFKIAERKFLKFKLTGHEGTVVEDS